MTKQFIITDEMKKAEAARWERRSAKISQSIAGKIQAEIKIDEAAKFNNADIPAPLKAFTCSEAANDALEATREAFDE